MNRRVFLGSISFLLISISGCVGEERNGGFLGDSDDNDDSGESRSPTERDALHDEFETRGLEVLQVEVRDDRFVIEVQTTGNIEEDIRISAGAYATIVSDLNRDLRVRIEDRGSHIEAFEIEQEWAQQFIENRLTDEEYFNQIQETTADD